MRLDWSTILDAGADIVDSYSTPVTLRQLHYRLVAAGVGGYGNTAGPARPVRVRRLLALAEHWNDEGDT